jgi:hypothetical protein
MFEIELGEECETIWIVHQGNSAEVEIVSWRREERIGKIERNFVGP